MIKFLTWVLALSIGVAGLSSCSRISDSSNNDSNNVRNDIDGRNRNTIHTGQGAPETTLGKTGDYYLAKILSNSMVS